MGTIAENFEYDLADTPCADVLHRQTCFIPRNVQQLFPKDQLLADMGIDAYFGTALRGVEGKPLGLIVALHDQTMEETELVNTIMALAAGRTVVEIERLRSETAMRGRWIRWMPSWTARSSSIPGRCGSGYVNEGAVRQVGYSREELLRMTPLDIKPEFDEPQFRAMIAPLVSGSEAVHSFTTIHRRKDIVDVPVEVNLQCVGAGTARLGSASFRSSATSLGASGRRTPTPSWRTLWNRRMTGFTAWTWPASSSVGTRGRAALRLYQ